jgi:hypothetical protein
MKVSPDKGCEANMRTENGLLWEYEAPVQECLYYFGSKDGKFHRMTSIGYSEIFVRDVAGSN